MSTASEPSHRPRATASASLDRRGFKNFESRPTNTVEDTARYLSIGLNAAYAAIHVGELPSVRVGRKILVPTGRLLALLNDG